MAEVNWWGYISVVTPQYNGLMLNETA